MAQQATGTETLVIGCKLPHGFIMELIGEGNMTQPAPRGETIEIAGANSLRVKGTNPLMTPVAYTTVDASIAREWFKRNASLKFVKNGSVFVKESAAAAASEGKDRATVKTGLEPLDPDNMMPGVQADKDHLSHMKSAVL